MSAARSLPIVDFSGARLGEPAALAAAAAAVHTACVDMGFFLIRNHGIPDAVIDRAVAAGRAFFAQDVETKRAIKANARHRGFHALGDALMYGAKRPDEKEFFSMGLELPEDDPLVLAGEPLRGPNQWPTTPADMRPAFQAYFDAVGALGRDLLGVMALSLGLSRDFFERFYTKPLQRTQMLHYPPQPPVIDADRFGVAPHSDYGCVTLLWQDETGGLQVRDRTTKSWIEAEPITGTLVVNVGDLLERWSNDRFASTPHRVINRSGKTRFSIATFYDPDFSAVIDPRDLGTPPAERHYEPIRAGDHILQRFDQSFGYRKSLKAAAG